MAASDFNGPDNFPARPEQPTDTEPQLVHRRLSSDPAPAPVRTNRRRGHRRPLHLVTRIAMTLVLLVCLAGTVTILWLRHVMTTSLPQLDGVLHLSGLHSSVTVTRDDHGIPSIHATRLDDLLFAQGYVTAQDRLWQMDILRRHAAGQLAAILGSSLVDHDRQQRTLQLRAAADRALATMPPDQLAALQHYANGINAFIDGHRDRLPVEFSLLHYQPAAWQPRDSVMVLIAMWQDLTTSFPTKLDREALTPHLAPELLADLYPSTSFRDHPPAQQPVDLTTPKPFILQIPLDSTQSALYPDPDQLLQRQHSLIPSALCDACRAGSNNWAVSAQRSASGAPLVSNDMHLGLSIPDIWYEAALHLSADPNAFDATGFTLPGVPFIVAGRNTHVAWSFTNLGADVQDLYIEHLRGSGGSTEFQHPDGTWSPAEHHTEHITVRGGKDVTLDVLTTTHAFGSITISTPIISPLYPSERRALALAWTLYDPAALQPDYLAIDRAASGDDLVHAFATFGGPSLNLIWADDAKHIGYHALGFIPVRGPAEKHPRNMPLLDIPQGGPPIDPSNDPDNPDNPDTPNTSSLFEQPHFTLAAFTPPARHRRRIHRAPAQAKATPKPAPEPPPQPAAPAIDYTIGNPPADVPVDALDATHAWSSYVPFDQLPAVVDPPSGVLATANNRITTDDYPYTLTNEWADAYRAERIYDLLENRSGVTPDDMLRVQLDTHSALSRFLAQRLSYAIDHASPSALGSDATRLHAAADLLRKWDGNMTSGSAAPSIADAFRTWFWPTLLAPHIRAHDHLKPSDRYAEKLAHLYIWPQRNTALELLLNHQPARWLPPGYSNWNDFLTATLETALKQAGAPHDLSHWTWATQHRIEINHPLLSHKYFGRLLAAHLDTGPHPIPGDPLTVRASGRSFGPSERFTADLAATESNQADIPTGESGNPRSPFYLDQFPAWLNGSTFPLPLEHPQEQHRLTLEP